VARPLRVSPLFLSLAALGVSLSLVAASVVGGCTPTDPNWDNPCGDRGPLSVEAGTGSTDYQHIGAAGYLGDTDAGLLINVNDQRCNSLWLGLATTGFGRTVYVTYGVTDIATGVELTRDGGVVATGVELTYDTVEKTDRVWGLPADFAAPYCHAATSSALPPPYTDAGPILGHPVLLWATVKDQLCGVSADGRAAAYVTGFDTSTCIGCLSDACTGQLTACDADCIALQACIDARCIGLSQKAIAPGEDECQQYCESLHSTAAAQALVSLAACVQQATQCFPPCLDYPFDFKQCTLALDTGACASESAAYYLDLRSQKYQACASACTTKDACLACSTDTSYDAATGEKLVEAYWQCQEQTCIAPGWVLHM
jgi:hypothetical protein